MSNKKVEISVFTLQLISGAFGVSVLVLIFIHTLGLFQHSAPPSEVSNESTAWVICLIAMLPTIVSHPIYSVIKRSIISSGKSDQEASFTAHIIRCSLFESSAVFGFVASVLAQSPIPVALCGIIAFIGIVITFPRRQSN